MNVRPRVPNIASRICVAALLCAAAGVSAQTIYRNVDDAGKIAYSDRPDMTPPAQTAAAPDLEETKAPARISGISARRAALIDANESARRLRQAQLKRKQGMAPMPGERAQGSDASVVNYRYWQRQETLRRAVENAQRRSDEASRPQLAGR